MGDTVEFSRMDSSMECSLKKVLEELTSGLNEEVFELQDWLKMEIS